MGQTTQMQEDMLKLVLNCTMDVAREQDIVLSDQPDAETTLFGKAGIFDSMALVSLIVAVEQEIQDSTGIAIALADERALSQSTSPYRTVGALAGYAARRLAEHTDDND